MKSEGQDKQQKMDNSNKLKKQRKIFKATTFEKMPTNPDWKRDLYSSLNWLKETWDRSNSKSDNTRQQNTTNEVYNQVEKHKIKTGIDKILQKRNLQVSMSGSYGKLVFNVGF